MHERRDRARRLAWPALHPRRAHLPRRALVLTLAAALLATGALAAPDPAAATTTAVADQLLELTNADRAARGLRPLRPDARLAAIAEDRAMNLTGATTFGHAAAGGSLSPPLAEQQVQWYGWAENLAWTPGGLRTNTASALYLGWKRSPSHWASLMSPTLNYVGFGAALRASDGHVFASAVFTESRDHTPPSAWITGSARNGRTVTFTWRGSDPALQTHWAGLRDFDAWYRVDDGAWRLLRDNTTSTSICLASRPAGHRYWLMVRARDRAGNAGRTSAPTSVWVP